MNLEVTCERCEESLLLRLTVFLSDYVFQAQTSDLLVNLILAMPLARHSQMRIEAHPVKKTRINDAYLMGVSPSGSVGCYCIFIRRTMCEVTLLGYSEWLIWVWWCTVNTYAFHLETPWFRPLV